MKPNLPLSIRLLRGKLRSVLPFLAVFSFGLGLFITVEGMSRTFTTRLESQSREILEGDLRVESRRPFTETEHKLIDSILPSSGKKAEVWGFLSMVRATEQTRLVQIKAIDPSYPLVGAFEFETKSPLPLKKNEAVVGNDFVKAMKAGPGDSIKLGRSRFVIKAIYNQSPGGGMRFWDFGMRIYVPLSSIPQTGLDQKGSRIFRYRFWTFPEHTDVTSFQNELNRLLTDPEIEITGYRNQKTDLARTFNRIGSFLKLAALVGFFLATAGAAYFFLHHLQGEKKNTAILRIHGMPAAKVRWVYIQQNLWLSITAVLLALLWNTLLYWLLPAWLSQFSSVEISPSLDWTSVYLTLLLGLLAGLTGSLSGLIKLPKISPSRLLKGGDEDVVIHKGLRFIFIPGIQVLIFLGLAFWVSRSIVFSLTLGLGIIFALGILVVLGVCVYQIFRLVYQRLPWHWRLFSGNLRLSSIRSLAAFSALGVTVFLIGLLPQLRHLLTRELAIEKNSHPQFFLFDIQEHQQEPLNQLLDSLGYPLSAESPMIRARLEKVNGKDFRKINESSATMEQENRRQWRNRGFNLSYRESLSPSERITSGKFWEGPASDTGYPIQAEVSLEKEFAGRLEMKVGDSLLFDVQGVEVLGVVTSFRSVQWTSFLPNFFVLFQPGVLEIAPKTFLSVLKNVPQDEKFPLQEQVVENFPNVTMLDVEEMLGRITSILDKLQALLGLLTVFAGVIGLSIFLIVLLSLIRDLSKQSVVLQVLGLKRGVLRNIMIGQFLMFCLISGLTGYLSSVVAVFMINRSFWNLSWDFDGGTGYGVFMGLILFGLLCGWWASQKGISGKIQTLLKSG